MGRIKDSIETEKNIEIRKRKEVSLRKRTDIILIMLLGGSAYGNVKSLYSALIMIVTVILLLIAYLFFESFYIDAYAEYTDNLIRKNSK